ncbi:MAG TPA: HAD-IA family hydrolase [Gemmatimonadales bacterium]|nr:HAD-IA family hydrolase [Gemmatimonadales bacterium]
MPEVSLQAAAILFDLDGVLVDSAACIEGTWRRWALHHHLDPAQVIALAHGRRATETLQLVAPHLPAETELAALAASESSARDGILEIAGAREMLQHLPPGTWGIVTSGIREAAIFRLRHTGLPVPEVLVCADEIQQGKPDPEGYLTAARQLGVSPNACVVVEDAPAGLEAARAAGMRSIAVSGTYTRDRLSMADYTIPYLSAMRVTAANNDTLIEIRLAPD